MRKARTIWNLSEESDWYAAFLVELDERKVPRPVSSLHLKAVMESARAALKVLKVERRRPINSVDSIRGALGARLVDNGVFPRDYLQSLRRSAKVKNDPKDAQIAALNAQIKTLTDQLHEANTDLKGMDEENNRLLLQPSPLELIEDFFARIIRKGLKPEEPPKPHGVTLKIPIPEQERARRKDPLGFTASLSGGTTKPKFAIVSSFDDVDKGQLHRLVSGVADMRYIDGVNKFTTLGRFNADGGRIILWTDKCQPSWEAELQNMGVSFHRHKGPQSSLVQHIKEAVAK